MTDYHPLTEKILERVNGFAPSIVEAIDQIIREHLTPPVVTAESGVRFPDLPDTLVSVAGNFITSGSQMQMVLVGSEPVLVVQPEFDADENEVTLITTAVDLPPAGLVQVLEALLDGTREIVRIQAEQAAEDDAAVAERARALQAAGPDEYPTGYYEHLAREQLLEEATVAGVLEAPEG